MHVVSIVGSDIVGLFLGVVLMISGGLTIRRKYKLYSKEINGLAKWATFEIIWNTLFSTSQTIHALFAFLGGILIVVASMAVLIRDLFFR
jgi:ABC-type Fe3+-siderophore transport system permease subunit